MILGAHESVAGGLERAFERCARDRAHSVQLWTRSSRQWAARPLDEETVRVFRQAHRACGQDFPTAAHASYLINLAAGNDAIYQKSIATLTDECERAERLGVKQVIFHPGAAQGDLAVGIRQVAAALKQICRGLGRAQVQLVVECTAGQGSSVGCSFEQLAEILDQTGEERVGICLDTQHLWAAGIDWTTPAGYQATFAAFERLIGFDRLAAFHLNDSKKPLGSRVDRHEVIGDGLIGLAPFGRLVRDERFATTPGFLETPPLPNGEESYALGLERLRSLLS